MRLPRIVNRPVRAVNRAANKAINTPIGVAGRHRPLYALNLLDWVRGPRTLEDAVKGKVVLVTGASSGIGEATALRIGAAGATVVLVARGRERLEGVAERISESGGRPDVRPCDLNDLDAVDAMAAGALADHGAVDVLVNNAGRSIRRSFVLSTERFHDYERTMALNYFAPVRLMLNLVPEMVARRSGHVVNISTAGVQTRTPRFGAYIASKAALDALSDALQAETRDQGVRFTTVHMPLVRTPMIAPTDIYRRFPSLSPLEAAEVVCEAVIHRPRRMSPPFGAFAQAVDGLSPEVMDEVRSRGYRMFPESGSTADASKPDGGPPA